MFCLCLWQYIWLFFMFVTVYMGFFYVCDSIYVFLCLRQYNIIWVFYVCDSIYGVLMCVTVIMDLFLGLWQCICCCFYVSDSIYVFLCLRQYIWLFFMFVTVYMVVFYVCDSITLYVFFYVCDSIYGVFFMFVTVYMGFWCVWQ